MASFTGCRTAVIGASCLFPCVLAEVTSPNRQQPFAAGKPPEGKPDFIDPVHVVSASIAGRCGRSNSSRRAGTKIPAPRNRP